jgi:hypothetical protein
MRPFSASPFSFIGAVECRVVVSQAETENARIMAKMLEDGQAGRDSWRGGMLEDRQGGRDDASDCTMEKS